METTTAENIVESLLEGALNLRQRAVSSIKSFFTKYGEEKAGAMVRQSVARVAHNILKNDREVNGIDRDSRAAYFEFLKDTLKKMPGVQER